MYLYIITNEQTTKRWKINLLFYSGWKERLKEVVPIAFHSAALVAGEYWGFYFVGFEAAYFGEIQLSAHIILINVVDVLNNICCASSQALASVAGAAIGANLPMIAKRYIKIFFIFIYTIGSILSLFLIIYSREIASLFSNNASIIKLASNTMPLVVLAEIGDYFQMTLASVIRSLGQQRKAYLFSFLNFAVFLQILVIILGFLAHLQIKGLWLAFTIAWFAIGSIYLAILTKLDWDEISLQIYLQLKDEQLSREINLKELSSSALLS